MLLYLTGVITLPHIGNSNTGQQNVGQPNVQDGISTTPSNPSSSSGATDNTPVTPSIKIESATATLISVNDYDSYSHTCTIKMSGTVTGSLCSFLSLSVGRNYNGEPAVLDSPFECPSWRYWGTSPLCSRDSYAPATTNWSITIEQTLYDFEGYKREFIAILDTAKQPVVNPSGGNPCTATVEDQRFTDSVFLTC
jgi:hypothetical protein